MRKSIFWFRNDLRLSDNEALVKCIQQSDAVLPVFIFENRWFAQTQLSFPRMGPLRRQFLAQSVEALQQDLRGMQADLLLASGAAVDWIPQLVATLGITDVYGAKFWTDEEVKEENALEKKLFSMGCALHLMHTETLLHPADLPFPIHALPDIFTKFRKEVEPLQSIRKPWNRINSLPLLAFGPSKTVGDLGFETSSIHPHNKGGEKAALDRLNYYIWETQKVANYKITRNGLLGLDYSTRFSHWLAVGCLSARTIFHEIKAFEKKVIANESTYWVIFELLWRDYFKLISKKYGNQIFQREGLQKKKKSWKEDTALFWRWAEGKTGNPFIDANMKEMNETGFMSNRGRQNVASFLVRDLQLDWTWGAAYFESQLIDYDCSSNWGNWTYVAGVGNDPREDRYFNTWKQASMYDPEAAYIKTWLPQLAHLPKSAFFFPDGLTEKSLGREKVRFPENYPKPLVTKALF